MLRGISIALGIGLIVLWLVGVNNQATLWLTWLDGIAALWAFTLGASIVPGRSGLSATAGAPLALSLGLYVLWGIGLLTRAEPWLAWWTFVFACAFLALGIFGTTNV